MNDQAVIDLKEVSILDIYGVERIPFRIDAATSEQLADILVQEWIPYMECHKCGRSDYCKYAQPHPVNPHKKREIKCGVAETALRNFINRTFSLATTLSLEDRQKYLDGRSISASPC